jgi:hypothetical protein
MPQHAGHRLGREAAVPPELLVDADVCAAR